MWEILKNTDAKNTDADKTLHSWNKAHFIICCINSFVEIFVKKKTTSKRIHAQTCIYLMLLVSESSLKINVLLKKTNVWELSPDPVKIRCSVFL